MEGNFAHLDSKIVKTFHLKLSRHSVTAAVLSMAFTHKRNVYLKTYALLNKNGVEKCANSIASADP